MCDLTFWAKTNSEGNPGISVRDHCINTGCVAEELIKSLPQDVRDILPQGAATLVAAHDVGKISPGFQVQCQNWLEQNGLLEDAKMWGTVETDHSKVTQYALQKYLRDHDLDQNWAIALGAHHGKVHGREIPHPNTVQDINEEEYQNHLIEELIQIFGKLPEQETKSPYYSELWLLAGLTVVADWIASNENFFLSDKGIPLAESRCKAKQALERINWFGGDVKHKQTPSQLFGFDANPLQKALLDASVHPGLFIVEGPMGCGKTEAALLSAYRLIESGKNQGLYFGLPTQVTSNRIYLRVEDFLKKALSNAGTLRLAHGASWMQPHQVQYVGPELLKNKTTDDMRSWFASAKLALLARYGVGTVDQALQAMVAVKHFFVRRFGLAGKVVILDEVHSYDVYTGSLITALVRELLALKCSVIILSATLTQARRQELLQCAKPKNDIPPSNDYPLITSVQNGTVCTRSIPWEKQKTIYLTSKSFSAQEIENECIHRAKAGQNVLYIRNTVDEAQATYNHIKENMCEGAFDLGVLHSHFPYFRREELESKWLERLGKNRKESGRGSILISTQVVEQSVDIDLDFIVSDLAPSDMLLQRMGRLWRHPSHDSSRKAGKPEFWINLPQYAENDTPDALKQALGKSGKVYARYVLLKSAQVFQDRDQIVIPGQIREILEATYANTTEEDPDSWSVLWEELRTEKEKLQRIAQNATRVLSNPAIQDQEGYLTRYASYKTCSLVLFRNIESLAGNQWKLTGINGESVVVSKGHWNYDVAKMLFKNTVKVPSYLFQDEQDRFQNKPDWIKPYISYDDFYATVDEQEQCLFGEFEPRVEIFYNNCVGINHG